MEIKEFFNFKGQKVGWLDIEKGIYRRHMKGSKHILKVMNAIGISKSIVEDLNALKTHSIRVKDDENDKVYSVSVEKFNELGVERDLGQGLQIFLPLQYWEVVV